MRFLEIQITFRNLDGNCKWCIVLNVFNDNHSGLEFNTHLTLNYSDLGTLLLIEVFRGLPSSSPFRATEPGMQPFGCYTLWGRVGGHFDLVIQS